MLSPTSIGGLADVNSSVNKGLPTFATLNNTPVTQTLNNNILQNIMGTAPTSLSSSVTPTASSSTSSTDDRVRIAHLDGYTGGGGGGTTSAAAGLPGTTGGDGKYPGIQAPLSQTSGLMFPYTPQIQITQQVDYGKQDFVHSNWNYYYYSRTPNAEISISGKFTVQNQTEGAYAIAAIQFLRGVSKMNFGQNDQQKGLPPPMLQLSGYGDYMFNKVRVFVKTHSYTFDENMDTVVVSVNGGGKVRLPAVFTLSVTLVTQPTVKMMRTAFSLDDYRSGALLQKGAGFF